MNPRQPSEPEPSEPSEHPSYAGPRDRDPNWPDEHAPDSSHESRQSRESRESGITTAAPKGPSSGALSSTASGYQQVPDEPYEMALRMLDIIGRLPDEHAEQVWNQLGDRGLRGYVFAVGLHRDLERAHLEPSAQDDTTARGAVADRASDQATSPATTEHDDPLGLWDTWHLGPSLDFDPASTEAEGIGDEVHALDQDPDQL